jgi:hypothetical protein
VNFGLAAGSASGAPGLPEAGELVRAVLERAACARPDLEEWSYLAHEERYELRKGDRLERSADRVWLVLAGGPRRLLE